MKIVCDACGAKYSIADEKVAGKVFKIRCKKCSNIIVVRGATDEAAPVEEEQPAAKETKVFDYAGYDNPQDAMAAAEEGEWHVVIDQEQVGPLTAEEVRQRFSSGEIDSDTYIWKEGFDDWERIPEVPEFADLESTPAAEEDAGGGMFGDAPAEESPAAAPADLFAGDSAGGGDLFGSASSSGGDLFGGGDDAGGDVGMSSEAEAQLKGQRNENSVLFSLGNLAALASDTSAKPAAAAAATPGVASSGGSEGSGLIDIRSMASVYLSDKGDADKGALVPAGSADDLPVFSQSAFGESASPVLLPVASGGTDKKLVYILAGVIGVLLIAGVVIAFTAFKDDKPAEVASNEDDIGDSVEPEVPEANKVAGDTVEPTPVDEPETQPTTETDPVETAANSKPTTTTTTKSTRDKPKRDRDRKKPDRTKPVKPKPAPVATSTKSSGCDEVTCLVEPNKACCRKYNKTSSSSSSSSSSNSSLPEKLSRSDITKGIGKVRGRVTSCGDKHGGAGTVKVKIKIGGNGKVQSAQASGGGSSLRSCVTSAVKRATFKKTQKGMSVTYPFVFR